MTNDLVCPECGCADFYADHTAVVRRTYTVNEDGYVSEGGEEIVDLDRDFDSFTCDTCSSDWQESDLITEEQYNMKCDYEAEDE